MSSISPGQSTSHRIHRGGPPAPAQLPPFGVALVSHNSIGEMWAKAAERIGYGSWFTPRGGAPSRRREMQIRRHHQRPTFAIAALLRAASPSVPVEIDRHQHRTASGRPQNRDVVGGAVIARAGFVADAPVLRQLRAQPRAAGLVGREPGQQLRSRRRATNARPAASSRRLPSIALGVVVSRGSPGVASLSVGSLRSSRVMPSPRLRANAVTAAGPPKLASSRLAAVLSLSVMRRLAQLGDAHARVAGEFASVPARARRIRHEVAFGKHHAPLQVFLAAIHARQYGARRQQFEGAAHRKALVRAQAGVQAGRRIDDRYAQPPAAFRFDLARAAHGSRPPGPARALRAAAPAFTALPNAPALPTATPAIETPSIAPANFRLVIIAAPCVKPQLSVFRRPLTNDDKLDDSQENLMPSP